MADFEIVKGLAEFGLQGSISGGSPVAIPEPVFSFTLSESRETENLLSYQAGRHQTKFVNSTTSEYTVTMSTQVPTFQQLGLARSEDFRTIPGSTTLMRSKYFTIPSATYQISVPGLLAANAATTAVTIEEGGGIKQTVGSGAPTDNTEVQIADGTLTFDSSREGDTAFVTWFASPTGGDIIGGPGTRSTFSEFYIAGEVYDSSSGGGGGYFAAPRGQITTPPDIAFTGDAVTVEVVFELLSVTGWEEPFLIGKNLVWPT